MAERRVVIDDLKLEFDLWFAKVRELFPEAITVEEENNLIWIVKHSREIQTEMLDMLRGYDA
jgi:hypothetical protein